MAPRRRFPALAACSNSDRTATGDRQSKHFDRSALQVVVAGRVAKTQNETCLLPRPATAQVYLYLNARDARLIADIVRLNKGHTEGLEPKIIEELVKMIVAAPGGKARRSS